MNYKDILFKMIRIFIVFGGYIFIASTINALMGNAFLLSYLIINQIFIDT
jgi:hypothetical protein